MYHSRLPAALRASVVDEREVAEEIRQRAEEVDKRDIAAQADD